MKLISVFTALMVLIFAVAQAEPKTSVHDLNGIWKDVGNDSIDNCYLIIAQQGNEAHMTHYLEVKGVPMVEFAEGKVKNNKVTFDVKVSKPIPGWAVMGVHRLQISHDGNTLEGEFEDARGTKGPLKFIRARPAR